MSIKNELQVVDTVTETHEPIPLRIDLRDISAVRKEMSNVYRDMRRGKIKTQDGTRLMYALNIIRTTFESEDIQKQLQSIETTLRERNEQAIRKVI